MQTLPMSMPTYEVPQPEWKLVILRNAECEKPPEIPDLTTPLDAVGKRQAEALAKSLVREDVTRIFFSYKWRDKQTAQILAERLLCEPESLHMDAEVFQDILDGRAFAETLRDDDVILAITHLEDVMEIAAMASRGSSIQIPGPWSPEPTGGIRLVMNGRQISALQLLDPPKISLETVPARRRPYGFPR